MNLELFPEVEPSQLDELLKEIDSALDAGFLADVDAAFELARTPNGAAPGAAA